MGGIRKIKAGYVPVSGSLNRSQRVAAREAITWLLSIKKHTELGIAEHFGMSQALVAELIRDMEKMGRVSREKGFPVYISLKNGFIK